MNRFCRTITIVCALMVPLLCSLPGDLLAVEAVPPTAGITGTVLETISVDDYTYLNVETVAGSIWAVIPKTSVAKSDKVTLLPGMEMKSFHSKTLDRTFESLIFTPGIAESSGNNLPAATRPVTETTPTDDSFAAAIAREGKANESQPSPEPASGGSMGAIVPLVETEVAKAEGANAHTVAELFEKAKKLNGAKVRVRGRVVKYSPNIMGRNWLHLQDGTGDPMYNTHDLVITTTEELSDPQVITVEGRLAADKDFGAGYTYAVIIEDCHIIQ